jgi:arabinose-5-phosphate isomerase
MTNEATGTILPLRRAHDPVIAEARQIMLHQSRSIADLARRMDARFVRAVEMILAAKGHVVVIGVGKSGQIGKKIASTFASTGTPSFFVSAAEAHHGDLGMVTDGSTVIAVSYSGETDEVVGLLPHLRRAGAKVIAIVGNLSSTLARNADVVLDVAVEREACPHNLAPTTSTLATLAMGDALAVALMQRRDFTAHDFARCHPGGSLGRRLLSRVRDVMRKTDLPIVAPGDTVGESLMVITQGRLGLVLVMVGPKLVGLITDGDLRRGMQRHEDDLLRRPVSDIMTSNPVTVDEDTMLTDALHRMQALKIKALVAVDGAGRVSGVVEVFDDE